MSTNIKPLGEIAQALEECGHDISYAYDDLIFFEHSAFILQFDQHDPKLLNLFFNQGCPQEYKENLFDVVKQALATKSLKTERMEKIYVLDQLANDEIKITFV